MSKFSDTERARIIDESRAALARGEAAEQRQREQEYLEAMEPDPEDDVLQEALNAPTETHNQRVAREIEQQEREFARARRRRERSAEPAPAVDLDMRIAEAVVAERERVAALLAEIIARQREEVDDRVHELRAELAKMKAEVAEQRVRLCELEIVNANLRQELAVSRGTTIDLPALPLRSRAN